MNARESILKAPVRTKAVKAFGNDYTVRVLSGRERDQVVKLSQECREKKDSTGYRETIAILVLGDSAGAHIFTEADREIVSGLDSIDLENIVIEGLKLNQLWSESAEAAKKV